MSRIILSYALALFGLFSVALQSKAETSSAYQKGTITKQTGPQTLYQLTGTSLHVWLKPCGDFQTGQVEYRIEGNKASSVGRTAESTSAP